MLTLTQIIDFFLHLNIHLAELVQTYGDWVYVILFVIVFCETGLIITPFLPGDSLLFAAGSVAAIGNLNVHTLIVTLITAALLGDNTNYFIGRWLGPKVFAKTDSKFFNPKYLHKTHEFYQRYGGKTIIIARFIPIIRTFTPFVAGIGRMAYPQFLGYSILAAFIWVCSITYISYLFGNIPFVQQNFSLVILAIIVLSLAPTAVEVLRARYHRKQQHAMD